MVINQRFMVAAGMMATGALVLSGCSIAEQTTAAETDENTTVTIMTHDSFNVSEELITQFEEQTGYRVQTTAPGDAGAVLNQLILQKDQPTVDAVYGIDSYSAPTLVAEDMLSPVDAELPAGAEQLSVSDTLAPIDQGQVCVNADNAWFEDNDRQIPTNLQDLADNAELFATTDPTTSSPGLAFLVGTIAEYGADGWQDYWQQLLDNSTKVAASWSEVYYEDFTHSSDTGQFPLVLSYSSSPAETDGETTVVEGTCTTQVEYAGVLKEAKNPEGAQAFIEFMLAEDFQSALPETMYMYPVDETVELPADWAAHAQLVAEPTEVDVDQVAENRDEWLNVWTEIYEN